MAALLEAGFDAFIDLTEAGELPPYDIYLPGSVLYVRKPIPDHGVPRDARTHGRDPGGARRGARRAAGACTCIAAPGSAAPARWSPAISSSTGLPADAALIRLNELWQGQRTRPHTWPDVPETDEQRDYILRLDAGRSDPMQAPDVMDAARTLRERFQGALVGLAVGDALAAHTQFRKPGSFAAVGDLLGGGPFDLPRGAWTDDTAMALLLAESLLEREGFDAHDQVQRYVRWQREGYGSATGQCVGISANVARALATAQYKRQPFAGSHDPEQLDKDPLSRVAPVVMYFFADAPAAVAKAAEAARITAQAPMVLDCVRLLAAMVHLALSGRDKPAVLRPPRELWIDAEHAAGGAGALRRVVRAPHAAGNHRRRRNPAGARGGALGFSPQRDLSRGRIAGRQPRPRLGCGGRGLWPAGRRLSRRECDSRNLA